MVEPLTLAEEIAILAEARDLAVANRNYWQAEASAIRAKTIEDAAQTAEWFINIEKFTARAVAARIRALAQSSTSFEKTSGAQTDEVGGRGG